MWKWGRRRWSGVDGRIGVQYRPLRPNDKVIDIRRHSVRPVVLQHPDQLWISFCLEVRPISLRRRLPLESLVEIVLRRSVILQHQLPKLAHVECFDLRVTIQYLQITAGHCGERNREVLGKYKTDQRSTTAQSCAHVQRGGVVLCSRRASSRRAGIAIGKRKKRLELSPRGKSRPRFTLRFFSRNLFLPPPPSFVSLPLRSSSRGARC